MWTQFWDMNSGGGQKEKWQYIYIEAPEEEAKIIFYNRFGHNPERVSCTCCGRDYSISEKDDLAQLTGFHRGCRHITRAGKSGKYAYQKYIEADEKVPRGWKAGSFGSWHKYMTLDEYCKQKDVLIIKAKDIKAKERIGEVPEEGYIWR